MLSLQFKKSGRVTTSLGETTSDVVMWWSHSGCSDIQEVSSFFSCENYSTWYWSTNVHFICFLCYSFFFFFLEHICIRIKVGTGLSRWFTMNHKAPHSSLVRDLPHLHPFIFCLPLIVKNIMRSVLSHSRLLCGR